MFRVYDDYSPMIAIISELQGHTTDESRPLHQHADVQVQDSPDNALSHGKQTSPTATALQTTIITINPQCLKYDSSGFRSSALNSCLK